MERSKLMAKKTQAIHRLDKMKTFKRKYDPADHYMRGKEVATWKGKAA